MKAYRIPFCLTSIVSLWALATEVPAALWTAGHGDLAIRYTASPSPAFFHEWVVGTGGDSATVDGAEVYDTSFSATALTPRVGAGVIASPDSARTGGSVLRLIPQDGTDAGLVGSPFQGWTTVGIPGGLLTNNRVQLRLTGVMGPGAVSAWEDDGFGGAVFRWSSADGFSAADLYTVNVGGHSHMNLAFSQPGNYRLAVTASGTLAASGNLVSTPLTFSYTVVPEPSGSFLMAAALMLLITHRRR